MRFLAFYETIDIYAYFIYNAVSLKTSEQCIYALLHTVLSGGYILEKVIYLFHCLRFVVTTRSRKSAGKTILALFLPLVECYFAAQQVRL